MSRNSMQWTQKPNLPPTHYADPIIYSDPAIFEEEKEKIFKKVWQLAIHESEVAKPYDFRTYQHPGGTQLVIVRGEDMKIRTFYNICPHRGNLLVYDPSGNANTTTLEPKRKDASGNKAAAALPKIVACHPVDVATYCRPFTEYEIADPRCPAPV